MYVSKPGKTNNGYKVHKDAFKVDKNMLQDNQRLRKFTFIIYLNSTAPDDFNDESAKGFGCLRLHLDDKLVDVIPR